MSKTMKWTGERLVPTVLNEIAVEHLARYSFAVSLAKGKKILDIACGEGYGSYHLSKVAAEVVGVDINAETIAYAASKYIASNLRFAEGNAVQLPLPDQYFDVVVSFETIEHLEQQQQMLAEIKRVLTPGGILIISTPNKVHSEMQQHKNLFHEKELTREEFADLLKDQFTQVHLLQQHTAAGSLIVPDNWDIKKVDTVEGDFHQLRDKDMFGAPPYFLALASDLGLPQVNALFFDAQKIMQERLYKIQMTATYKLGALLLAPFHWIKKTVRRK